MAGQIVMEGFLNFRMRPWLRRLVTRTVAIIPAALTVYFAGANGTFKLLILSQVILNMQLPFAVIPLIQFTSSRERMGEFANRLWLKVLAWSAAVLILSLDIWLVAITVGDWLGGAGRWRGWLELLLVPVLIGLTLLLVWIIFQPVLPVWIAAHSGALRSNCPSRWRRICRVLRTSEFWCRSITPARIGTPSRMPPPWRRQHHAKLYLLHVEEGVTSQVYGALASTAEVEAGAKYLDRIAAELQAQQVEVEAVVRYSRNPKKEIVRYAEELKPDLVVMGAHGHKGIKDIVFGTTINAVRHKLKVPLLVVRGNS